MFSQRSKIQLAAVAVCTKIPERVWRARWFKTSLPAVSRATFALDTERIMPYAENMVYTHTQVVAEADAHRR